MLYPAQRRRVPALALMLVIGAMFEAAGIGLTVPILALATQPDWVKQYPWLQSLLSNWGLDSFGSRVAAASLVLLSVYLCRAAYSAILAATFARFLSRFETELSVRLFSQFVAQPWAFHTRHDSARLMQITKGEATAATYALNGLMTFTSEAVIALTVMVLLVVIAPIPALITGACLCVLIGGYYAVTHRALRRWGLRRQRHDIGRVRAIQQGLGAIREVIVMDKRSYFTDMVRRETVLATRAQAMSAFVQQVPRISLELVAVSTLAGLVLVLVAQGAPESAFLPAIGLFAAAAGRLLPSASKIVQSVQSLVLSSPAVEVIVAAMRDVANPEHGVLPSLAKRSQAAETPSPRFVLEFCDVAFRYEGGPANAVTGLTFSLARGMSVGFIGPSGAGKSTILDLALGLLQPSAGRVLWEGRDIQGRLAQWHAIIGYVPQSPVLIDATILENIAFGEVISDIDRDWASRCAHTAALGAFLATLPEGLGTRIGERGVRLSGGQRQRIAIARALYRRPEVVILDEATSALDSATESEVTRAIEAIHGRQTLLVVAHRLSTIRRCDSVFLLGGGAIVDYGSGEEMFRKYGGTECL
jgi:ABC-type multidrug transport system fused ATPase/permease subunit